ncbi:MAG: ACT domain-containing protein [Candidatus Delongbacteria bacterium]
MAISEATIRELTRKAIDELGPLASPDNVRQVVRDALARMQEEVSGLEGTPGFSASHLNLGSGTQVIVTVFGKNKAGVLAEVARCLADFNGNVIDISQKILQDWFTMILIVDISELTASFAALKKALGQVGEKLGVRVLAQHEDVFVSMHRV